MKYKIISLILLGFSACIYIIFRTEQTLINQIFQYIFSKEALDNLRQSIQNYIYLPAIVIYSVPEACWIASLTLLGENRYIKVCKIKVYVKYVPLLLILWFEAMQFFHLLHGTFDWYDILLSAVAWAMSYLSISRSEKQNIFTWDRLSFWSLIFVYSVVILAHVRLSN